MLTFEHEKALRDDGYIAVCGVDEAGRGPLAGPVVAAACILPIDCNIEGLNDSKKLSEKKREALFEEIKEKAIAYSIASASNKEIDEFNILNATMLAMARAIEGLPKAADFALVDGNCIRNFPIPAAALVKGDAKCPSIAAASILAKVTRDRICMDMDKEYPEYNFKKHKGYPTKEHRDLVIKHGPCPLHRRTFLKFMDKESV
ncbi:MAG: ribonuclease HII [Ruminococcaceae bacterium]|nr:ribonuclease HII [Oscillospiraceae bacterium]